MSAEALVKLRTAGHAPAAVWVVVGDCPDRLIGLPDCIQVRTTDRPDRMDWRSVMGLHVDIFDMADDDMLLLRTMDAIEAAQPKAMGIACTNGVMGLSEQHENAIWRIWRNLANS